MSQYIINKRNRVLGGLLLITALLPAAGCKKFIEVDVPVTSVNANNVYQNDNTAVSVLTDIYSFLSQREASYAAPDGGFVGISLVTELTADNLTLFFKDNTKLLEYYENDLKATNTLTGTSFWDRSYEFIYRANAAIEGLTASNALTPAVKQQLLGEARFFRAFYYFYLVNLYGDVPLAITTDYTQNAGLSRTSKATVYQQIITDLTEAKSLLNDQYVGLDMVTTSTERIRVNKGAATALLARVYLYTEDFTNAEKEATEVINNSLYSLATTNINDAFLKNSKETIWSLQPVLSTTQNTWETKIFLLPATGPNASFPVYLSDNIIAEYSPADKRLSNWIGAVTAGGKTYYYPRKYKAGTGVTTVTEYQMVLRLAEQYLIRAEARAQQDNLSGTGGAGGDLNVIRSRAGLSDTIITAKEEMLNAILHERRKELFTEWGHRWLDLKRMGKIDEVMQAYAPVKGAAWESYKSLFPIAQTQIDLNPAMKGQQNPGYSN